MKILKSNDKASTISLVLECSCLNINLSICVIYITSSCNANSGWVSLGQYISCNSTFNSSYIWDVSIKILESNLDFVSITHWLESIFKVNIFVSSIVLRCNFDNVSWAISFEFISKMYVLLLSWGNSHDV